MKYLHFVLLFVIGLVCLSAAPLQASHAAPALATASGSQAAISGTFDTRFGLPGVGGGNFSSPHSVGNAMDMTSTGDVYVGGQFGVAGSVNANNVARYNRSTGLWEALGAGTGSVGNGTNGTVHAVLVSSTGIVYVGGDFSRVYNTNGDTIVANNIARWFPNTQTWEYVGSPSNNGTDGTVYALAEDSTGILFVGGTFGEVYGNASPATLTLSNVALFTPFGIYAVGTQNGTWGRLACGFGCASDVGPNDTVRAIAIDHNNDVYVGGNFTQINAGGSPIPALKIAHWENIGGITGGAWTALGAGLNDEVYALDYDAANTRLFVGGRFTEAGANLAQRVAVWNGSWSRLAAPIDTGVDNVVYALRYVNGMLYIGGFFTQAYSPVSMSNIVAHKIARFNFTSSDFEPMGGVYGNFDASFPTQGVVRALANYHDGIGHRIGLAGDFSFGVSGPTTGVGFSKVAEYLTAINAWNSLAESGATLGITPNMTFTPGPSALVHFPITNNVFVSGPFTAAGSEHVNFITRWDGSTWRRMASTNGGQGDTGFGGNGLDAAAYAVGISPIGGVFYAAGSFQNVWHGNNSSTAANRVATWNGTAWSTLTSGPNGTVLSISFDPSNDQPYFAGAFTVAGGNAPYNIARYNAGTWEPLGANDANGTDGVVHAMVWLDGKLYVGGSFSTAYNSSVSNVSTANIAMYDPATNTWSALGTGTNDTVFSLATDGTYLYAGGIFTQAGGQAARRVARFDPATNTWSPLGNANAGVNPAGFSGEAAVLALAVSPDGKFLYVGGEFGSVTGNGANFVNGCNLARVQLGINHWQAYADGPRNTTSPVAGQCGGSVNDIAVTNDTVHLVGSFSLVGNFQPSVGYAQLTGIEQFDVYLPTLRR